MEGLLKILFPEEGGIIESCPEDSLVSLPYDAHIFCDVVAYPCKVGHQPALFIPYGEVPLIFCHRKYEYLFRYFKECLVKASVEHYRIFVEVNVLFKKLGVYLYPRAKFFFNIGYAREDHFFSLFGVGNDKIFLHISFVF